MSELRGSRGAAVFIQLERLFQHGTATGWTEGELIERFVKGRDQAAFEAIVARHGPMVLRVCRQLLRDPNDVDDAFQATFLVLVRRAASLRRCELLGNWLYGVAHRVAFRARALAARRMARTALAIDAARSGANHFSNLDSGIGHNCLHEPELEPWLHQEIARLPEKYRVPIVLCYMEGLTHDDAARRLEWPLGTVKGRLARARDLLRRRLARRGVALSAGSLATSLSSSDAKAAVSSALIQATLRLARSVSSRAGISLAASSTVSLPVAALGEGVLQTMTLAQIKTMALPLFLLGLVTTGVVALAAQGSPREKKGGSQSQPPAKLVDRRPNPAPNAGRKSTTQLLRNQLDADQKLYDSLVAPGRSLRENDFPQLVAWSLRLLEGSQSISAEPPARAAAYTAHRDRMKKLNALAAQSSLPDATKKMTQVQLKEAEELLESANSSRPQGPPEAPADMMKGMMAMAGQTAKAARKPGGVAPAAGGMGGGGGMSGMMGGMFPALSPEADARRLRPIVADSAAQMALHTTNPRSQVVLKKLDEPISMSFAVATPLDDILKYVKQATCTPTYAGVPVYVDPKGLDETNCTVLAPVTIDLEGIPLKTTLRLALKQLGLAYCVRDGVIIISSVQGINEELEEERSELDAVSGAKELGFQ
jgi:RNA polymerase sigma factor (sigma-70 family)